MQTGESKQVGKRLRWWTDDNDDKRFIVITCIKLVRAFSRDIEPINLESFSEKFSDMPTKGLGIAAPSAPLWSFPPSNSYQNI